jgi:transcriptional regulator with XRE-family HTH domain
VLAYSRPYGVAKAMERVVARAREAAETSEWQAVAAEVAQLADRSGLTRAEFASRIGTSPPRLSTYVTGKVTPSAALLVRMRNIAER